ncbi:hypothetical protein EYV94_01525 [Puteibacter caeruleilacunae]|nr:hypothetical protein EYV94_01525 [Puteibacter caeruleilacunae]
MKQFDNIFHDNLKDLNEIPSSVNFREDQIFNKINTQINKRHSWYRHIPVAVLLFLVLLLGGVNWHLNEGRKQMVSTIKERDKQLQEANKGYQKMEQELLASQQASEQGTLHDIEQTTTGETTANIRYVPVKAMAPIIVKYEVKTEIHPIIDKRVPVYITMEQTNEKKIGIQNDPDLPVYYESENLALKTTPKRDKKSISQKFNQFINN